MHDAALARRVARPALIHPVHLQQPMWAKLAAYRSSADDSWWPSVSSRFRDGERGCPSGSSRSRRRTRSCSHTKKNREPAWGGSAGSRWSGSAKCLERAEERDQIRLLLLGQVDVEAVVVEVHHRPQVLGEAVVE